jgi:hypothetical protein
MSDGGVIALTTEITENTEKNVEKGCQRSARDKTSAQIERFLDFAFPP